MKHPSSRELFAHWTERRADRAAPERIDIEPGAIRKALGDTFVLAPDATGEFVFRLAGTGVCALFGRELRNIAFTAIWHGRDRAAIREGLAEVGGETVAMVASASARTVEGFRSELECLLLPLRHRGRPHQRMIGVLAPLAPPPWLGASRIETLDLAGIRVIDVADRAVPTPDLATAGSRDTALSRTTQSAHKKSCIPPVVGSAV